MTRRSETGPVPSDGGDDALQQALRQRSAQRITDLREPTHRATGTERISRMLAEARQDRDGAADEPEESEAEVPGGTRLLWSVTPLEEGHDHTESNPTEVS